MQEGARYTSQAWNNCCCSVVDHGNAPVCFWTTLDDADKLDKPLSQTIGILQGKINGSVGVSTNQNSKSQTIGDPGDNTRAISLVEAGTKRVKEVRHMSRGSKVTKHIAELLWFLDQVDTANGFPSKARQPSYYSGLQNLGLCLLFLYVLMIFSCSCFCSNVVLFLFSCSSIEHVLLYYCSYCIVISVSCCSYCLSVLNVFWLIFISAVLLSCSSFCCRSYFSCSD